jgi:S-sulfo-L-cysteine synthase (O-acetyl-L-serine-dependent)
VPKCELATIEAPETTSLVARLASAGVARAIGQTPLVAIRRFAARHGLPSDVEILLKTEGSNPGGSVKDRPALAIVRSAIESGTLHSEKTLLDATSGNTGIAYAMLGAAVGFRVNLVVPASASDERKRILAAYGAEVTFSDPYDGSNGAIRLARELAAGDPDRYFYADQYRNPANIAAHFQTTGPEIWEQTEGHVTHFVAGLGTTGTMMGTGAYLKHRNPGVILAAVQPAESFHGIEGLKHLPTAIVPEIYDAALPDRQIAIDTEEAYDLARELAAVEGLFAGASTGAALAGALRVGCDCAERGEAATIVVIAPDGGGKYLSTGLWA